MDHITERKGTESMIGRECRADLLERARLCWESASGFRRDRDRNKRFTYGDQWSDIVNLDYQEMREDEHLRSRGHLPLKNNLIRRLVRNVLGVFRNRCRPPVCRARDGSENFQALTMQKLLRYNAEINRLSELYARTMEEFLISGLAVHKKWYGRKGTRTDCWTDFVQPDNFFLDGAGGCCRTPYKKIKQSLNFHKLRLFYIHKI